MTLIPDPTQPAGRVGSRLLGAGAEVSTTAVAVSEPFEDRQAIASVSLPSSHTSDVI